jgi:phenylalanyl-tRNA synthetase alpha subunit
MSYVSLEPRSQQFRQYRQKKKSALKRKTAVVLISLFLLVGGTQVYAATVLDSNLIQLIKDGVSSMRGYFVQDAQKAVTQDLRADYQKKINDYVKDKTSSVISDIQNHRNSEVSRANQELNAYFEQMKKQVDDAAKGEVDTAKNAITAEVNKDIISDESAMNSDLLNSIKEQFKQK